MNTVKFSIGNMIGGLVLTLLSVGVLSIAWSIVKDELLFLATSRIVEGTVVDHIRIDGSRTGPMSSRAPSGYYPIVRYLAESGQEHRVQGRLGAASRYTLTDGLESGTDARPLGSTMRVAYRRDNPEDARVLGLGEQYLFPVIITVIGLVLLMFAVLVFRDGISRTAMP